MIDDKVLAQAEALLESCRRIGRVVATAESCTGGLIAASLTAISGSSDVVDRGFVTYSNAAKTDMLGVAEALLAEFGAVSEPVARAMAEGAIAGSLAHVAVSVTGIAGPGGATPGKPVGLVWFGLSVRGGATRTEHHVFSGDRAAVRYATVVRALELLCEG